MTLPTLHCRSAQNPFSPALLVSADGSEGEPQSTRLSISYSRTALLVVFHCLDFDIWGTYERRDDPLYEEEVVEVFLSPTGDLRRYYEFEVSPLNVVFDARVHNPDLHRRTMQVDTAWDCQGLETSVRVEGVLHTIPPAERVEDWKSRGAEETDERQSSSSSWTVEMRIPFSAFPEVSPPGRGDVWRANFYRIDRADPPEFTAWSPTLETPPNFHVPQRFGYLRFE